MTLRLSQKSLSVSIKSSLLTSVFLLLVILGGMSIMSKMRLSALQETIETVGRDRLPKIRALGELNVGVARIRTAAVRMALASTTDQRAEVETVITRRVDDLNRKIEAFRDTIEPNSPMKLVFDQFAAKWAQYVKQQARILDPEIAADRATAANIVNVETPLYFQAVVDAIDDGIKLADQEADHAIDNATADSHLFSIVLWSVNAISILIGFATLIFVIRDVSTPIHRITESMERIAKGHLATEIPYAEHANELGMMARALAVFRKSLVENERLNAATRTLSELSEWLQSAKSETELYDMISSVLGRLMPECKGSLYIYANSRDVLEVAAQWNGEARTTSMHPEDCWSLRRGHFYVHGTSEIEFHCDHVHKDINENYCCIPILAHGDTVGLLHLEYTFDSSETAEEAKARFADRVRLGLACAEHLSIAIANMKLREGLRDQSVRDVLTGLNNRRYLLETARRELLRAARHKSPVSVVTLDVDHFKTFNDNHGHDAGDTVLRHVGEILRATFADDGVPCRFGGEEFVVLLPGATTEEGGVRAEELRARIESMKIRYADSYLPRVTISAGVASYPDAGGSFMDILRVADDALYQAKQKGRNRVEVAASGEMSAMIVEEMADKAVATLETIVPRGESRPASDLGRASDQKVA
ncbi:Putative diguanylate cyclase (GGDEF) with GAF and HAMP domains [Bradyrhizobium sp. ORS 278]|uniref:diguanylate cyclase n=1 Tax=Bradyrhizobium sp. (strain ORS 278) TaxID=114615 RepID=UPI0001507F10|nr:diguanylate cyclase [Bradyrhizobium sp. ORS 278]CAL75832.1 Putative diguanylate cyclase (GGDEF) with GAF and HAMP domains [Bradyrhizobium sp. ORS 278]